MGVLRPVSGLVVAFSPVLGGSCLMAAVGVAVGVSGIRFPERWLAVYLCSVLGAAPLAQPYGQVTGGRFRTVRHRLAIAGAPHGYGRRSVRGAPALVAASHPGRVRRGATMQP